MVITACKMATMMGTMAIMVGEMVDNIEIIESNCRYSIPKVQCTDTDTPDIPHSSAKKAIFIEQ